MNTNPNGPMTGRPLPAVTKKVQQVLETRQKAERMIERLIAILDEIDGEAELEPSGDQNDDDREDEPSLGWAEMEARYGVATHAWSVDAEFDDADSEPSLGSCERHPSPNSWDRSGSQIGWAGRGSTQDLEGDAHE